MKIERRVGLAARTYGGRLPETGILSLLFLLPPECVLIARRFVSLPSIKF
jgi:hypothetical protein